MKKSDNKKIDDKNKKFAVKTQSTSLARFSPYGNLTNYLKMIKSIPRLSIEEEKRLAIEFRDEHNMRSAQKLIESNLYLVASVAFKYKNYRMPFEDVISQGNIGLMKAVKKFDPDKGFRLSTYAVWWIKSEIQDLIMDQWSMIKIDKSLANKTLFFNFNKKLKEIGIEYKGTLSDDEIHYIAEEYKIKPAEVREIEIRRKDGATSLNETVSNDEGSSIEKIDMFASDDPSQENIAEEKSGMNLKKKILIEFIKTLNVNEKEVIKGRFLEEKPLTLEVLGKKLGISKERVRQIESEIKMKLQRFAQKEFNYKIEE